MEFERGGHPAAQTLTVSLQAGESLTVESGSVVSYSPGVTVEKRSTGVLRSVARRAGIQSVSLATARADANGVIRLAPPLPGTITKHDVETSTLAVVQTGSYLAAGDGVTVQSSKERGRAFLEGEGLFVLRLTGTGPAFLAGYGGLERVDLGPGDVRTVNTGYVVAFEDTVTYDVDRVDGLKSTVFGDAGLVCRFEGPGSVWTQTRSHDAFLSWIIPQLPE